MANWIYYPQSPLIEASTIVDDIGTSASETNMLNNRILSKCEVSTVTGGEYRPFIDVGSGNTITPDFIALVNHNLYQAAAGVLGLTYSTSDTLSGTSPAGGTAVGVFTPFAVGASDEPIVVKTSWLANPTKRYWWPDFSSTDNTLYVGCLLIGNKVAPSIDPNWEQPILIDIESGRIVNTSPSGYNWKTRTAGVKRGWQVKYQFCSDANRTIIEDWITDTDYVETPFVFTMDGGTTYKYGELIGNHEFIEVQQGLTDITFSISEVIA
jgi:hypothetical protein